LNTKLHPIVYSTHIEGDSLGNCWDNMGWALDNAAFHNPAFPTQERYDGVIYALVPITFGLNVGICSTLVRNI